MTSSFPFYDPSWIYRDVIRAGTRASLATSSMIDTSKIINTTKIINTSVMADLQKDIVRNSGIGAAIQQVTRPTVQASGVFTDLTASSRLYEPYRPPLVDTAKIASVAGMMQTNFISNQGMRASVRQMTEWLRQDVTGVQAKAAEVLAQQWARPAAIVSPALFGQSGTAADGLAALWSPIARQPNLIWALGDVANSIRTPGPLGLDYAAISRSAARFSVEMDALPRDDRDEIERAVDAAADATQTSSPGVQDQVSVLGLEGFARRHNVDLAIILAFTVGLTYVVLQAGAGFLEPGTFYEAAVYGGGTFEYIRRKLQP